MKWFIILMMIATIPSTMSMDNQFFTPYIGDRQTYSYGADIQFGNFFPRLSAISAAAKQVGSSQEAISRFAMAKYYDIMVTVEQPNYFLGETVVADVIFMNKGDLPDHDSVLTYYLTDGHNNTYGEARRYFEEVPPYFYNLTECEARGGYIENKFGDCVTKIKLELDLPRKGLQDQWRFNVDYETVVQEKLHIYDTFYVFKKIYAWFILIVILLMYFITKKKKKKDEE